MLFAVAGASSSDTTATLSLSNTSTETVPPTTSQRLAIAMPPREVRAGSAPQRTDRQVSPLPGRGSYGPVARLQALPAPRQQKIEIFPEVVTNPTRRTAQRDRARKDMMKERRRGEQK